MAQEVELDANYSQFNKEWESKLNDHRKREERNKQVEKLWFVEFFEWSKEWGEMLGLGDA